jgi:glycosidase
MLSIKLRLLIAVLLCLLSQSVFAQSFQPPEWSYNKSIYEVNIRQYSESGTFNEFSKHLPRLKEMGVGIIWLMPIHPIGEKNRKGTLGSYYSVRDYKDVNPGFGTKKDFKSLVDKIHKMGMYVIIDWVANHTAWDHKWMNENPEFYTKDSLGNFTPPVPDWSDVVDLNYDNKELWTAMIDAIKFWVDEYDIDGYRCDVAGMVPIKFWIEARKELNKIKPVFVLAEWDTPEMHKAFDMTYDWTLHNIVNGIEEGGRSVTDLIDHINLDNQKYPVNAFRMQFTSNHDENTWNGTVFERLGSAAELFAVFSFLIPDMPLIYSGQEAGLNKRLEFFEKDQIEWKEHEFTKIYSKLLHLKKNNEALFNGGNGGDLIFVDNTEASSVISFVRKKNKDKVLALFNLSNDKVDFEADDEALIGSYKNLFTGKMETFSAKENYELAPWGYRVFVK